MFDVFSKTSSTFSFLGEKTVELIITLILLDTNTIMVFREPLHTNTILTLICPHHRTITVA